jgi:Tol biopolymer transport system component
MLQALLFSAALFAPPPKGLPAGRITLWAGDKIVHMNPDGTDAMAVTVVAGVNLPQEWSSLTPDYKTAVSLDGSGDDHKNGILRTRLTVCPLDRKVNPFVLEGYVTMRYVLSDDGTKVYFSGIKANEVKREKSCDGQSWTLDLATKKITKLPLPDNHFVEAVTSDGKTFVTVKTEVGKPMYSRRTYLTPVDGGKPFEILKENTVSNEYHFSADGTKLLIESCEFSEVRSDGAGGHTFHGAKPREFLVIDTTTRATSRLMPIPDSRDIWGIVWSPDGSRIAYVCRDTIPGEADQTPFEFKVFVADARGGNAKEVYKMKGDRVRTFTWK